MRPVPVLFEKGPATEHEAGSVTTDCRKSHVVFHVILKGVQRGKFCHVLNLNVSVPGWDDSLQITDELPETNGVFSVVFRICDTLRESNAGTVNLRHSLVFVV